MQVARRTTLRRSSPDVAVGGRDRAPIPPWNTVGATGQPAYASPFLSNGEGVRFRQRPSGLVEMRGSCDCAYSTSPYGTMFTLPVAYRPNRGLAFVCPVIYTSGQLGGGSPQWGRNSIYVLTDGRVYFQGDPSPNRFQVISFDQVRYFLDISP